MWKRILTLFGIKVETPQKIKVMITNPELYVLIEINQDSVTSSEPMELETLTSHIVTKYNDQPLKYFNEYKRLKVIQLKSGKVRDAVLRVEF
jgi:hypothetical protein